jgi:hypothetical protein
MVCCLVCDESRKVVGTRPTNGLCSNCGGPLRTVRIRDMFRLCFIPICCTHKNRVICSRCGAQYH